MSTPKRKKTEKTWVSNSRNFQSPPQLQDPGEKVAAVKAAPSESILVGTIVGGAWAAAAPLDKLTTHAASVFQVS